MTTTFNVEVDSDQKIRFGLTGVESIKQNISLICSTVIGSCPLYRDFGVDPMSVDQTLPAASVLLQVDLLSAIERFEARAIVTDISVRMGSDSKLIPIIKFVLAEEV